MNPFDLARRKAAVTYQKDGAYYQVFVEGVLIGQITQASSYWRFKRESWMPKHLPKKMHPWADTLAHMKERIESNFNCPIKWVEQTTGAKFEARLQNVMECLQAIADHTPEDL